MVSTNPPSDAAKAMETSTSSQQAGGGAPVISTPEATRVTEFSPPVATHIKQIYEAELKEHGLKNRADIQEYWHHAQGGQAPVPDDHQEGQPLSFQEYGRMLQTSNALEDLATDVQSYDKPLSNYFISSSHNTYLTGNQLYGEATTDGYKNVLLRGCRCVEIDVWDGAESSGSESSPDDGKSTKKDKWKTRLGIKKLRSKTSRSKEIVMPTTPTNAEDNDQKETLKKPERWRSNSSRAEPVVLHGYTATKEVPYREVCKTIGKYAFMTSPLPLIVSLEVHTDLEQQKMMVDIMKETWGDQLLDLPYAGEEVPLPTPQSLLRKILIKVKYSPPKPASEEISKSTTKQLLPTVSSSDEEQPTTNAAEGAPTAAAPHSKMYEALSQLGVYTRSFHFKCLDQPEAKIPTHVFSLSENKFMAVHEKDASGLSKHNRDFLMRAYPKGIRVSSSNLNPAIFWRHGVQMVALNWQHWDAGTMLNEAMFAGSGGYMLKPPGYRGNIQEPPGKSGMTARYTVDLTIEFLAGQNLPLRAGDKKSKDVDLYVKCELHVELPEERKADAVPGGAKAKGGEYKCRTKKSRGPDPDFAHEKVEFNGVQGVVPELTFVRFKVMENQNFERDDLVAWACIRLDRLGKGIRFVHLFDRNGIQTEGVVLLKVTKTLKPE